MKWSSVWGCVCAFGLALILAVPVQVHAAHPSEAQAAVAMIRDIYEGEDVRWSREDFTPHMQALFAQAEVVDEMGLDFDPFIDAQDLELSDIEYSASETETGVQVQVRFQNMGEPRDIRIDMIATDQGWKIADMASYGDDGRGEIQETWRLSALLGFIIAQGEKRLSAESFVRTIYISETEVAEMDGKLTPDLEALFEVAHQADAQGLNFNPFLDADRAEISNIRFGSWITEAGTFVEVEFVNIIRRVYLIYEVVETDEGWRIADIVALSDGREKWRLTDLLRYLIANPLKAAS